MKDLKDLVLHKVCIDSDRGVLGGMPGFAQFVNKKLSLYLYLCAAEIQCRVACGQRCLKCF